MTRAALSERVERSVTGRVVISVAIVLVLLAGVATHLPPGSALHRSLGRTGQHRDPPRGVEQQWAVFAPDPRSTSLEHRGRG